MLARYGPTDFNVSDVILIFDVDIVVFTLDLCIAVITQAVLCIQTSAERFAASGALVC